MTLYNLLEKVGYFDGTFEGDAPRPFVNREEFVNMFSDAGGPLDIAFLAIQICVKQQEQIDDLWKIVRALDNRTVGLLK